jgi:tryptophan halogenase
MLNLRQRVCILGGGRQDGSQYYIYVRFLIHSVEIMVISAQEIPIVGVGEGA